MNEILTHYGLDEHFNTGFGDRTRGFQQHFIDLYAKTLLDKNNVPV